MLTLNRPLRHALFTMLVACLLVGPTVWVGWTSWRLQQPAHRHAVEARLTGLLGVDIQLRGVRYPRPGVAVLDGVVARAERTASGDSPELARIESLRWERRGKGWVAHADGMRLRADSPRQAIASLTTLGQRIGSRADAEISWFAPSCEIALGDANLDYSLRDLAGSLRDDQNTRILSASFHLVEEDHPATRCELTIRRQVEPSGTQTNLALRTAEEGTVPARVLDPFFTSGQWLGSESRIRGELSLTQVGTGDWAARFSGLLDDVELSALARRAAPLQRLHGRARVEIAQADWGDQPGRGPGWIAARGSLKSTGGGLIGSELLRTLGAELGVRLSSQVRADRSEIAYEALGLRFELDDTGAISLRGDLGEAHLAGTLIAGSNRFGPLALEPEGPSTVAGLIRALAPGDLDQPGALIPARAESLSLQRYLPAPPSQLDQAVRPVRAN